MIISKEGMKAKFRVTSPWDSTVRFIFISFLTICSCAKDSTGSFKSKNIMISHKHARRKLDDIGGDINIDCGTPRGYSYTDEQTNFIYKSDEEFINSGVNKDISPRFMSATLQESLANVRSFPEGNRNCYTLRPNEGKDKIYLIRASFMYGAYDDQEKLPEFDLYVGVNKWDSVKFDNASHVVIKEIIHKALLDEIYVCLLNIGQGTPFISALEVRHFHTSTYISEPTKALALYRRLDVGSTTNQIIRFEDDKYDRMWFPYPGPVSINTSFTIDALNESEYRLPTKVMSTAAEAMNVNVSLDLAFENSSPELQFYVYMHFAELEKLSAKQYREFRVELNGNLWKESVVPVYLRSSTILTTQPMSGNLKFSLCRTSKSTLPPILNAMEIYIATDFRQESTNQEDVNAILEIKTVYKLDRLGWRGDPCEPIYFWDGLNCSKNGYKPPQIISLNLTSRELTGSISPALSHLKSLQYLDLSNNSLTGPLPNFLSELPSLRVLNLEGNKLSGLVPESLKARSQNGSLLLSIDENPDLCSFPPCKKEKRNIVVPVAASIISSLVILIALLSLWTYRSYRRKQASKLDSKSQENEEGSLESENQKFTYSEIVNITNNFNRVLGRGGSGTVYHGYLSDGTQVAVKMLSPSSSLGSKQFRTEAQLLMRVHHKNLVSLVGYCNDGGNFGLIYEYMAYGNIKQSLLDNNKKVLSWKERLQIAVDAAQGLEYLHHGCKPPIIHRDVKTANILLNEQMQAKLADLGLSKFFPIESQSHLSTSIVGTMGYLDPEYCLSNRLTEKSDVYSFGIVVLELITAHPVIIKGHENTHIVEWTNPFLERGDIKRIVDPRLDGNFDTNSVWKAVETAMECVQSISTRRPTMSHVVIQLKECLEAEIDREESRKLESKIMGSNSVDIDFCGSRNRNGSSSKVEENIKHNW